MTIDEAIKTLQRAKREQAKHILEERKTTDKKKAMEMAGQTYLFRRKSNGRVEYIAFGAEPITVAHDYYSSRGIVLDIDVEY